MHGLTENDVLLSLLAFAILLLATRAMAELARRFNQPEVLGELLGGFLIGPSALGAIFPSFFHENLWSSRRISRNVSSLLDWSDLITPNRWN